MCCVPTLCARNFPARIHRRTVSASRPTLLAASGTVNIRVAYYYIPTTSRRRQSSDVPQCAQWASEQSVAERQGLGSGVAYRGGLVALAWWISRRQDDVLEDLLTIESVGHCGDDDGRFEEERALERERRLVVQDRVPELRDDKLGNDDRDERAGALL